MELKDELVFVDFFVHTIPFNVFAINNICDFSKAIKGILVANVAYNKNLVVKTSWK